MQKLQDFVSGSSHHFKPLMGDSAQSTGMRFHPRVDRWIALDSAVESQQFRLHRRSTFYLPNFAVVNMLARVYSAAAVLVRRERQ
jgi:hypothetical protein